MGGMAGVEGRSFDDADETRTPDKTTIDVVRLGAVSTARFRFEPGWKWSEPVVGTDSCQVRHVGVVESGQMHVVHDDGTEADFGPRPASVIEPGHDAWITGDEPFVGYEFESHAAEEFVRS
jgi:hypothetical protein